MDREFIFLNEDKKGRKIFGEQDLLAIENLVNNSDLKATIRVRAWTLDDASLNKRLKEHGLTIITSPYEKRAAALPRQGDSYRNITIGKIDNSKVIDSSGEQ